MVLLESSKIPLKSLLPDLSLPDTSGEIHKLSSLKKEKGLLVIFTCNHCPYALASWPVIIDLAVSFSEKGIGFAAVNPNDSVNYPADSVTGMKDLVSKMKIHFPYLRDELQQAAKEFRAVCTPDIYLYDDKLKLYYHGRINDNWQNPDKVTKQDLKDAIESLLSGKNPPEKQFPSMGCSIKWKESL